MNETIFVGNITAYMENPAGPVVFDIEQRAKAVVEVARDNVRKIMHRAPYVDQDVNYTMNGNEATIKINTSAGSIAEYLNEKVFNEGGSWLRGGDKFPDPLEAARLSERFAPSGV
jgi:hypothetical protein